MLRRLLFHLLTALFILGILYALVLVAARRLPWTAVPLLLVPAYGALRCHRIARWRGPGPGPRG
jgi:hypothetical protein